MSEALQIADVNMNMRSTQKSVVNDTINNLLIHTDNVQHIVSGEYESYTFAVEDPTDTLNLKNLMLHKQLDGSYLPILFTYDLNTSDLSNSVIQYQILDKTLVSSTQKSGLIDFIIGAMNPCGWDDSCACWRLDGDIIIIQMTSDTCNIFSAPVDTISPGESPSGGSSNSDPGSGGDPNNNPGGGPYTGSGSSSGSGSSNPDQPGNDDSADNDAPDDCLQLSNGDCFNGAATAPIKLERPSPVDPDTQDVFDSLEDELKDFINDPNQNELRREIDEYLQDENYSQEAKEQIRDLLENEVTYPYPHCSSFEFAQEIGQGVRACAVTDLNETFYAYGSQNGQQGLFYVPVNYSLIYFTMPSWRTNGQSATLTSVAVNSAFDSTSEWFSNNPDATAIEVSNFLEAKINQEMSNYGGTMTFNPPFNIRNPAPFVTSFFNTGNCN